MDDRAEYDRDDKDDGGINDSRDDEQNIRQLARNKGIDRDGKVERAQHAQVKSAKHSAHR